MTARQPVGGFGFVVVDTSFVKNVFGRDVTDRKYERYIQGPLRDRTNVWYFRSISENPRKV